MPEADVIIIGGGASGLAAALSAARAGARCCVLERDVEAGLPILATGNGRCNLSNAALDPARYRHPDAFRAIAGPAPEEEIASFFEGLGLVIAQEDEGRLYPITRRAESVRAVLLAGCERAGVRLRCACTLQGARYDAERGRWALDLLEPTGAPRAKAGRDAHAALRAKRRALEAAELVKRSLSARRIIIACGAPADAVAALFNLPCEPATPVLCPIACHPDARTLNAPQGGFERLDGLRVEGALTLKRAQGVIAREEGELLFRPWGVSGIAAFNLSRHAEAGDELELDLFPGLSDEEFTRLLARRETLLGPLANSDARWFDGLLAAALGAFVHAAALADPDPLASAARLCKRLPLAVTGLAKPEQAQAQRGGIPLDALDLPALAVRPSLAPALHACGAALDMDADCGGYNLAWAWLSGMRAGTAAGRLTTEKSPHA